MSVFKEYARYYDLLYRDKDYRGEAEYVHGLIQSHAPGARSLLNLGCGSGRHDRCLSELGYDVCGVDLSEEMLEAARSAATAYDRLEYFQGDVRTVSLGRRFDAVISLFHVMSYHVTGADLNAAFATARNHLKPGGLFLFDCWYGPGVLFDRPSVRVKELEDETLKVRRVAIPVLHLDKHVVDVDFQVTILDKRSGESRNLRETHHMRYLFQQEIDTLIDCSGLQHRFSLRWMTGAPPDQETWYLCCGATYPLEEGK